MSNSVLGLIHSSSGVSQSNNMSISDSIRRPTLRPPRHNTFADRSLRCSAGSQLTGPSRVAGFPLVGFGADVASGSNDSTIAISSPDWRSELRDGRR